MNQNTLALAANKAPEPGAIRLIETCEFGSAGDWISVDGQQIRNLSNERLPANMRRQFASGSVGVADVHDPVPIAGYLSEYQQTGEFLFDSFVQSQPVDYQKFKYRHHNINNSFLVTDPRASAQSAPKEVTWASELLNGETADLRLGIFVPWRATDQEDFPVLMTSARKVWSTIALWREYTAFASGGTLMTSGNWASSVVQALGAAYNWGPPGSEGASSNPIADLQAAHRKSMAPIWAFGMNLEQFQWFTSHPLVQAFYKSMNVAGDTAGMLRGAAAAAGDPNLTMPYEYTFPGIGRILVHNGRATTDPAVDPAVFWPNDIVLGFTHSRSMPPNHEVATAINFVLKNPTGGSRGAPAGALPMGVATNVGWTVRIVPMDVRGSGGDLMIVDRSEVMIMTANKAGAFISGIS